MTKPVYILNGPNLNLLGTREPEIYGHETLADIEKAAEERARALCLHTEFRQSNHEGELIDWVHEGRTAACGFIVNLGAYTHTSVALLDALKAADLPVVEVHLSNLFAREHFRHHSYVTPIAIGLISGFGGLGYSLALEALASHLQNDVAV